MDLGGGQIRDRGNHAISIACWLMNHDRYDGLVNVEAGGNPQVSGVYDVPTDLRIAWEFPQAGWKLTWTQTNQIPEQLKPWGAYYHGDRDRLIVTQGDGACDTEQKAKDYRPPAGKEVYLHPAPEGTDTTARHRLNWTDCIRTGARPAMDIDFGRSTVTYCILGNLAYLLGRRLTFDMARERFVDDPDAGRFLADPMRYPWTM
jgi:hypothetical protein